MDIKDQVPSLETCKRRKELGLSQDSLFWWTWDQESNPKHWYLVYYPNGVSQKAIENDWIISAPLASETLDRLPKEAIDSEVINYFPTELTITKSDKGYYICYKNLSEIGYSGDIDNDEDIEPKDNKFYESLAEAAAKMEVFLAEHNLLPNRGKI